MNSGIPLKGTFTFSSWGEDFFGRQGLYVNGEQLSRKEKGRFYERPLHRYLRKHEKF